MRQIILPVLIYVGVGMCSFCDAANISGRVSLDGNPPNAGTIDMSNEPDCSRAYPNGLAKSQQVLVNSSGGLQNVVVYISRGLTPSHWQVPNTPEVLRQKNCLYVPHVIALQVGQVLRVTNDDSVSHNVHVVPRFNSASNVSQLPNSPPIAMKFNKEELGILVLCNLHPWMRSYVAVFNHPFFAVTDADGRFAIANVPPGTYTLVAWHELYGTLTTTVVVGATGFKQDFKFSNH